MSCVRKLRTKFSDVTACPGSSGIGAIGVVTISLLVSIPFS
jgi:hypothetical protein